MKVPLATGLSSFYLLVRSPGHDLITGGLDGLDYTVTWCALDPVLTSLFAIVYSVLLKRFGNQAALLASEGQGPLLT